MIVEKLVFFYRNIRTYIMSSKIMEHFVSDSMK